MFAKHGREVENMVEIMSLDLGLRFNQEERELNFNPNPTLNSLSFEHKIFKENTW